MKILFLLLLTFTQTSAFAVEIDLPIGQRVYRGSIYPEGGVVVYTEVDKQIAYLRVRLENREVIVTEKYSDLSITKGCIEDYCVGQQVYLNTFENIVMDIVAVNYSSNTVLIKGILEDGRNYLFEHPIDELIKL
jgi:hypothetical protein